MRFIHLCFIFLFLTSCTLSFQNVDTHGAATDLIDENLKTDPEVSPTVTLPVSAL